MITIIQLLIAFLVISFFIFVSIQVNSKVHKKKSAGYYEIIIVTLVLIFQLTNLYKLLIKNEIAENIKTTEIIYRKPAF